MLLVRINVNIAFKQIIEIAGLLFQAGIMKLIVSAISNENTPHTFVCS